MQYRLLFLVFVASLCLVETRARAQSAAHQAEARTLFDEGLKLFDQGSYSEACARLEASYHLFAGIGTRGKLAECYEKIGRAASAWAMYQEVAALAGKAGEDRRVEVATQRAAALLAELAHLTIVLPPSSDVPGLIVKRAGEVVERGEFGSALAVDPGGIVFTVSAPGYVTQTAEVTVGSKQGVAFTVPRLEPSPEPSPSSKAPVSAAPGQSATSAPFAATPLSRSVAPQTDWELPVGVAATGAGVAAVVVGGVLALAAKSGYDGAFSSGECDKAALTCSPTGQATTDRARFQADAGGVLVAAGAAFAAGGGLLLWLGTRRGSSPRTEGLRVTPTVGAKTTGLTLTGGF